MNNIQKILSIGAALAAIIGGIIVFDGRWVLTRVYADDKASIQMRQLKFEGRGIQKDINDLEDRIANPKLPKERKEVYKERLRSLKEDMKEVEELKTEILKQKGGK